jgi:hypothetical protein
VICGTHGYVATTERDNRPCDRCTHVLAEVLISALCEHYFGAGRWESRWREADQLPDQLAMVLEYKLASPELHILVSTRPVETSRLGLLVRLSNQKKNQRESLLARVPFAAVIRHDSLICNWRYICLPLEPDDLQSMLDEPSSYLPVLNMQFRRIAQTEGFDLTAIPDLSLDDVTRRFNLFGQFALRAARHGFKLPIQLWSGREARYHASHSCGVFVVVSHSELATAWRMGKSGCGWCDGTGRLGKWRQFVESMTARGWQVQYEKTYIADSDVVRYHCTRHMERGPLAATRARLRNELGPTNRILPTCPTCKREVETARARAHAAHKVRDILVPFDARLRSHGMALIDWSWKGTSASDGSVALYRVKCQKCGNERDVPLHQTLQKLGQRRRKARGCPACARRGIRRSTSTVMESVARVLTSIPEESDAGRADQTFLNRAIWHKAKK